MVGDGDTHTRYKPKAYARTPLIRSYRVKAPWPTYTRCALICVTNARASIHARTYTRTHARSAFGMCTHAYVARLRCTQAQGRARVNVERLFARKPRIFSIFFLFHSFTALSPASSHSRGHLANVVLSMLTKCIRGGRKMKRDAGLGCMIE